MKFFALVLSLMLWTGISAAKSLEPIQFEDGEAVTMKADYAYLLVRTAMTGTDGPFIIVTFVRTLTDDEMRIATAQYAKDKHYDQDSNVVLLRGRDFYSEAKGEWTHLLAVRPGTYVIARQAQGICLCMGTVKFEAKPGIITDLGTLLVARDDVPTTIPELAQVVSGKRIFPDFYWWHMTVRPVAEMTAVPEKLKPLPRVPASYRAMGKFPNYFGTFIDRLEPIPGILGYDEEGNVLDLKAAQ